MSLRIEQREINTEVGGRRLSLTVPFPTVLMSEPEPDTESEEIVDPFSTLANLSKKAAIMSYMIKKNQVEQFPIGVLRNIVRYIWFANLVSDGGIEGLDNLRNAIITSRKEDKRIIFTPAHLSDADHPAALYLIEQEGRGLGIYNEIVWMAGVNMLKRPSISRFMKTAHIIYNVTPRDMNHLQTLLDKQGEFNLSKEQVRRIGEIDRAFKDMRKESQRKVDEACVKGKKPLAVYPEGGRSYDGYLKSAPPGFSLLFPRDDSALVVPYRVYGSRELNPPGTDPKILRRELLSRRIGGFPKQRVSMVVGEHYPSSKIWEVRGARRMESGREVEINPMDWVMANIANLDPDYVKPEDLIRYEQLMERFAPERNRIKN